MDNEIVSVNSETVSVDGESASEPEEIIAEKKRVRIAFVLDQQVGLRTQSLYLERFVAEDADIDPVWVPVNYTKHNGLLTRLPILPESIRGTMRGIGEVESGFKAAETWDAALWASWVTKSVPDIFELKPAFWRMDMTPSQMALLGAEYNYTPNRAHFMEEWKRRATERLYASTIHFFPWNEWVAESLRKEWNVPADRITPISPGVDVELFQPDPSFRLQGQGSRRVRFLFVGGDFARKGGDKLLDWARSDEAHDLGKTHPWEIYFVTRDAPPDIESLKNVFFYYGVRNNSQELVRLYQQCDFFVLPTKADCYSLVALEAMASGLPVVITDLGGISEIIDDDSGYLLPRGDRHLDTLHRVIKEMILNPERRYVMSMAARRRAVKYFDVRVCMTRLLDKLKSLIPDEPEIPKIVP